MANSFKEYLQSQGKSKSTVNHYTSYALDFLSWLDKDQTEPENATAKEVLAYLNHLQHKGQENKTRNIRLNVIKQFFTWQIDQGHRSDNPIQHLKIRGIQKQKLYPILDRQQLVRTPRMPHARTAHVLNDSCPNGARPGCLMPERRTS